MKKGEGIYNVAVIGAGTAGLVTAAGTAGVGGRVALIERNLMGGDCLNFGCVPSKALISSTRLIRRIRESQKWGLDRQEPQFDFEKVFERMRARRAKIAPNDSQERFESLGVDVFHSEARFVSPHEIEVNGQRLRAKNFVIATGSRAVIPKIEGIDSVPYFTNETIFDGLKEKPESRIVLGGGPIGCELTQTLCRLGTQVTMIQRGDQLLAREDRDVAEFLERRLIDEGVRIIKNVDARSVATTDAGKIALEFLDRQPGRLAERTFFADALLIAIGRNPNLQSLDLKSAGVDVNERGGARYRLFANISTAHLRRGRCHWAILVHAHGRCARARGRAEHSHALPISETENGLLGCALVHVCGSRSCACRALRKGSEARKRRLRFVCGAAARCRSCRGRERRRRFR